MKQQLILIETRSDGSRYVLPLDQAMRVSVTQGATYMVVDQNTGEVPEGLNLVRKGEALEVQVDGEVIVLVDSYYDEALAAEFIVDSTLALNNNVLIQADAQDGIAGAASGEDGYGFQYGGGDDTADYSGTPSADGGEGFWTAGRIFSTGFAGLLGGYALAEIGSELGGQEGYTPKDVTPPEVLGVEIVDTLAVDSGDSNNDGITNNKQVNLTLAKDAFSWEYSLNGGEDWTTVEVDRSSPDSINVSFELEADTVYQVGDIQVRQIDKAGNKSDITINLVVIVVDQSIDNPRISLATDTGKLDYDEITSDTTVNVDTNTSEDVSWQYSLNGGVSWVDGSGSSFELADNTEYASGAIQVRQTDVAGNISDVATLSAVITDSVVADPVISLESDIGNSPSDFITNNPRLNFTLVDDLDTWMYSVDGGVNWKDGGSDHFINLDANTTYIKNQIQVIQTDLAGNTSDTVTNASAITIDTIKPSLSLALANDGGISDTDGITSDGTVNVTGLEADAGWIYAINGNETTVAAGAATSFVLAEGVYAAGDIQVYQTDVAGNVSNTAQLGAIEIDMTPPTTVPTVDTLTTSNSQPIITGTAGTTALPAGETLTVEVGGAIYNNVTVGNDGKWSLDTSTAVPDSGTFVPLTVIDSPYEVIASVEDAAGAATPDTSTEEITVTAVPADTSIVVFDLVNDKSSSHSGRTFDLAQSYDIYILVDSTSANIILDVANEWSGAGNLGGDDTIYLVGSGAAVTGKSGGAVTKSSAGTTMLWTTSATGTGKWAAQLSANGLLLRTTTSLIKIDSIWHGTAYTVAPQIGYLHTITSATKTNILTTQGLA